MERYTFLIKTNEGSYDLEASVKRIGHDLLIAVCGGEKPHIGAVAVAQPRPSLKGPDITSASTSVICVLGHKEDQIAKQIAEKVSAALNTLVVVTAGIHWDDIPDQGIRKVIRHADILIDLIIKESMTEPKLMSP
jgi:hypothetical protein